MPQTLTAADVVATLQRHSGEETKSGALGIMRGIETISQDGNNVVVALKNPNADLPYLLTDYQEKGQNRSVFRLHPTGKCGSSRQT